MAIANNPAAAAVASPRTALLGDLPEWNLADLYPGMDAPELKRDLDQAASDSVQFENRWKGRLAAEAAKGAAGGLGQCLTEYEALEELIGRIVSYASLIYAGNTTDPKRAKLYGDVQEKMTDASAHLLFFPLELNQVDDAQVASALDADPGFGHYRPWVLDLRKDKPYQLEDRVEQLFHEKSITGRGAWNRLFDETMADLRFLIDGEELTLEPALNRLQDADPEMRRKASGALAKTFGRNLRAFTLITNTLAKDKEISDRWRGFEDIADSRHLANRVERSVVDALAAAVREAYPRLSHRYYAMKAKWLGMEALNHWDRNAPLPETPQATIGWDEARDTVLSAYAGFAPEMAEIALPFFEKQLDRRAGAARQGARRLRAPDRALGAPLRAAQLPGQAARRDDARARARPRRAPGAGRRPGRADGLDAADARRDRLGVRRDADLPLAARAHHRPPRTQGHARPEGRGHDQHGGAADRVLRVRAQGAHRAQEWRADLRAARTSSGWRCRPKAWGRRSGCATATRCSGPTCRTSSTRRSTSTPMPSATAW